MPGPLILGVPLWAWLTGGAVVGAGVGAKVIIDETGETAEQMGDAAEPVAEAVNATTRLVAVSGALLGSYIVYREVFRK